VLLKADADGPSWTDLEIADAFGCRRKTVENIRECFVTHGFEVVLNGQPQVKRPPKLLDGAQEAKVIALRLGPPPAGFAHWTLRLLAEQVVPLEMVESITRRAADTQENGMTKRKIEYWVIPPEADGEFVAAMELVLETYAQPYDARHPVLCMDEQPLQLLKEKRVPIAGTKEHPRRVDYEYERAGTASLFRAPVGLAAGDGCGSSERKSTGRKRSRNSCGHAMHRPRK
jgi:hypothetical protein